MSLPSDKHLSEVHLRAEPDGSADDECSCSTRFAFVGDADADADADDAPTPCVADRDGDLEPRRRKRARHVAARSGVVTIRHSLATALPDVGLQVWRGALLLADLLLSPMHAPCGATVCELGAGPGLTSCVAAAAGARVVFCTDGPTRILDNARRNAAANAADAVRVRRLDWSTPLPTEPTDDPFAWSAADARALSECTLLLAADCVYDSDATDALVDLVASLLTGPLPEGAAAWFALERRINFCVDELRTRAPAAEHFHRRLLEREQAGELRAERVPLDSVPQRFEYSRGAFLELWRVEAIRSRGPEEERDREAARATPAGGP